MSVAGTAGGGQEAVTLAKKERPNVILMDINMPDMDGITATEIISNTVPESPIIMMSVQGEQDYLRRSMLAGAREFLVKPFSADELINSIRHVHELEKVRRQRYAPQQQQQQQQQQQGGGNQGGGGNANIFAPPQPERGKIITFFSPKGGVGRTTIATNLAVALHQTTNQPVCLVDGSLPFGDIAVILNMSPKAKTIADLIGSFGPPTATWSNRSSRRTRPGSRCCSRRRRRSRPSSSPARTSRRPRGPARALRLHRRRHVAVVPGAGHHDARRRGRHPHAHDARDHEPQERARVHGDRREARLRREEGAARREPQRLVRRHQGERRRGEPRPQDPAHDRLRRPHARARGEPRRAVRHQPPR